MEKVLCSISAALIGMLNKPVSLHFIVCGFFVFLLFFPPFFVEKSSVSNISISISKVLYYVYISLCMFIAFGFFFSTSVSALSLLGMAHQITWCVCGCMYAILYSIITLTCPKRFTKAILLSCDFLNRPICIL